MRRIFRAAIWISVFAGGLVRAQTTAPKTASEQTQPPAGAVLFERNLPEDPAAPAQVAKPAASAVSAVKEIDILPGVDDPLKVTAAERDALTFTAYDLDLHLKPATASVSARAELKVRNESDQPLERLVLQISSSLHWEAISTRGADGTVTRLAFTPRHLATDADHTGFAEEAVVPLRLALAPGESMTLTVLYSGAIVPSAERLERIGAPADQASAADWDAVAPAGTALRGFGNVLWYPVAASPVFLGDGAKVFQAVGRARLRQAAATVRLRLVVEYVGDPPDTAFFSGRRAHLTAMSDNADVPVAEAPGVATATFEAAPLGFRTPSLFVTDHPAVPVDPAQADVPEILAVTDRYEVLPSYAAAATQVSAMVTEWLGPHPVTPLTILDHAGQPFEDDALLVRPMRVEEAKSLAPSLAHAMAHAWMRSSHAWIDEGLPQFFGLVWTDRTQGRAAALGQLKSAASAIAFAEPADAVSASRSPSDTATSSSSSSSNASVSVVPASAGQSLIAATDEVYYRTKAAAVWWMLRSIAGDEPLQQALQAYREGSDAEPAVDADPAGFELALEKTSHKDLRGFFNDWVYRDRGLPDLTIVNVTPRQLDSRSGRPDAWLVAVEVRNDGDAVADVPVTVSGKTGTETQRLRVPAHASVSTRIVFSGLPSGVQVNDGSVPETRTSSHTRDLVMPAH